RSDFCECLRLEIPEAEAPLNDEPLLVVKLSKELLELFLEGLGDKYIVAWRDAVVLDQLFQAHVALFADRHVQTDFGGRSTQQIAHLLFLHAEFPGDFINARTAAKFLREPAYLGLEAIK